MTPTRNEAAERSPEERLYRLWRKDVYRTGGDARHEIRAALAAEREPLLAIIQRFLDKAYHVWGCGTLTENCTCGLWQLRAEARALIEQYGRREQ